MLYLDTVLLDIARRISLLFRYRAYFLVDMEAPSGYVSSAQHHADQAAPELCHHARPYRASRANHLFRDPHRPPAPSNDQFIEVPGIRGLVVLVFTLPSYPCRLQRSSGTCSAVPRT